MFHQHEPLKASIIPFCTFRTPALMSYKVRLLTWSFRLFKSILALVKCRRSYGKTIVWCEVRGAEYFAEAHNLSEMDAESGAPLTPLSAPFAPALNRGL